MFLQGMSQEDKEKFMELVYKIANIDGDYAEEEQILVDSYQKELGVEIIGHSVSVAELVDYFSAKPLPLKKIILFETIGLINADDVVDQMESEVLAMMEEKFALGEKATAMVHDVAKKYQQVRGEINDVIFGG